MATSCKSLLMGGVEQSVLLLMLVLVVLLLSCCCTPAGALDEVLYSFNPTYEGKPIDWCEYSNGQSCGQPAAHRWCQAKGYVYAEAFDGPIPAWSADKKPLDTYNMYQKTTCDSQAAVKIGKDPCRTFKFIKCSPPQRTETSQWFVYPTMPYGEGEVWLDWCETWEKNCGRGAADAYCKSKGYIKAGKIDGPRHLYNLEKSMTVGPDKRICDERIHRGGCDTYTAIECLRKV